MGKEEYEKLKKELEQVKEEKEKLAEEFAEYRRKKLREDIENFIESKIKEGKILPAWKENGLKEFTESLAEDESVIEFSEGKKESKLEWFKNFLETLSAHKLFKDFGEKGAGNQEEFEEVEKLAKEIAGKED